MNAAQSIAKHVIAKLGGAVRVSGALGVKPLTVYCWTYRSGGIPARRQQQLLTWANESGLELVPEDFFRLPTPELTIGLHPVKLSTDKVDTADPARCPGDAPLPP